MAATIARRHLHVYTPNLLAFVTGAHSSMITLECISSSDTTTSPLLTILEIGCQTDSVTVFLNVERTSTDYSILLHFKSPLADE